MSNSVKKISKKNENDFYCKNYKLGIKLLTDKQLKYSFSEYSQFKRCIKMIIENGKSLDDFIDEFENNHHVNLRYDNIFSILGGRGTGKSSVIHTIRNIFFNKSENEFSIILPIIHPEIIDENDTIIGWIISLFKEQVDFIEKEFEALHLTNYSDLNLEFYKNCQFNEKNQLRQCYNKLRDAFFSKYTMGNIDQYSYAESVKLYADRSVENSKMITSCTEFWNMVVKSLEELKQYKNKDKDNHNKSFIFIFVDDLDLVPNRSIELISTIPKFLSHPRVIVIVTAAPKIFSISTKCKVLEKFVFSQKPSDLESQDYELIKKLNDQLVDKAFPPSRRFYLRKYYALQDKLDFKFSINDSFSDYKDETTLEKQTILCIKELTQKTEKICDDNLIIEKKESGEENINRMYFSFVGNTSREICNFYRGLLDLKTSLLDCLKTDWEKVKNGNGVDLKILKAYYDQIYDIIEHFLCVALESNMKLKQYFKSYRFFCRYADDINLFIDYNYLEKQYQIYMDQNTDDPIENIKMRKIYLQMYVLLSFTEYILLIIDPKRTFVHGRKILIEFIEGCDQYNTLFIDNYILEKDNFSTRKNTVPQILKQITGFYEHYDINLLFNFNIKNAYHINSSMIIYNKQLQLNDYPKKKLVTFFLSDRHWSATFLKILYFRVGGIWRLYLLKPDDFIIDVGIYKDNLLEQKQNRLNYQIIKLIDSYNVIDTNYEIQNEEKLERAIEVRKLENAKKAITQAFDTIRNENKKETTISKLLELIDADMINAIAPFYWKQIIGGFDFRTFDIFRALEESFKEISREEINLYADIVYRNIHAFIVDYYNRVEISADEDTIAKYLEDIENEFPLAKDEIETFKNSLIVFSDMEKTYYRTNTQNLNEFHRNIQELIYLYKNKMSVRNNEIYKNMRTKKVTNNLSKIQEAFQITLIRRNPESLERSFNEVLVYFALLRILEKIFPKYIQTILEIRSSQRNQYNFNEKYDNMEELYGIIQKIFSEKTTNLEYQRFYNLFIDAIAPIRSDIKSTLFNPFNMIASKKGLNG